MHRGGNPDDEGTGELDHGLPVEGDHILEPPVHVRHLVTEITSDQGTCKVRSEDDDVPVTQEGVAVEQRGTPDAGHRLGRQSGPEQGNERTADGELGVSSAGCGGQVAGVLKGGQDDDGIGDRKGPAMVTRDVVDKAPS